MDKSAGCSPAGYAWYTEIVKHFYILFYTGRGTTRP